MKHSCRLLGVAACLGWVTGCFGGGVEHYNVAFDVSPDGQKIVFSAVDGDLHLLDLSTSKVEALTRTPNTESNPTFSPDGKSVAYASDVPDGKGAALYLLALTDRVPQRITSDTTVSDSNPAFSADGTKLTFSRAHLYREYSMGGMVWRDWDIYVMNTDGTGVQRLTTQKYYGVGSPQFSHDAKDVIYSAEVPFDSSAAETQSDDTLPTLLQVSVLKPGEPKVLLPLPKPKPEKSHGAMGSTPNLSPDGKRIAFISDHLAPFQYDVCTIQVDGSHLESLGVTKISSYNQQPKYASDGKRVLFLAGTESGAGNRPIFSLWQVNTDGSNARELADSGIFTSPSTWKPKRG